MPRRSSSLLRAAAMAAVAALAGTALAEDQVLVSITGPLTGKVGDRASFEVEVVNRSGRPLQRLRVIDFFDGGFRHDASASPIEQKGTIDLAPGTARRLTLEFTLVAAGRQCHRVEILDQAYAFVGGATHCVEVTAPQAAAPVVPPFQPPTAPATAPLAAAVPLATATASTAPLAQPALQLSLSGPTDALSGDMVEYIATVRNTGTGASAATTLELTCEEGLTPEEATVGFERSGSRVSWSVPAIEPGGTQKRQLRLKAQAPPNTFRDMPATRSCVRAVLSGLPGGAMVADQGCVLVSSSTPRPRLRTPAEAGLRMTLADLDDPVASGGATTLVCTVTNGGTAPSGRLDLVVILPDQARLVGDPSPPRVRIDDSRVTFESLPGILPGGQQAFELTYRLPAGGGGKATAIMTGPDLDGSLERSCQTTFLAP